MTPFKRAWAVVLGTSLTLWFWVTPGATLSGCLYAAGVGLSVLSILVDPWQLKLGSLALIFVLLAGDLPTFGTREAFARATHAQMPRGQRR